MVGLGVGMLGVAAIVGLDVHGAGAVPLAEIGVVAVCYAVGPIVLRRWLSDAPALGVVAASLVLATILYAPFALYSLPDRVPGWKVDASVVTLAVVCTALAFVVFFALIADVGPVRATVITYVNPAVAAVLGVVVLGEHFTVGMAIGFALVLAGSVLATAPGASASPSRWRSARPRIPRSHRYPSGVRRALPLLAVVVLAAGCGGAKSAEQTTPTPPPAQLAFAGGGLSPPRQSPPIALHDVAGRSVTLAAQRGRYVLVTFLYVHCADVCPLIAQNLNAALRQLGPERTKVRVLAVSVDPKGDTPAAVRRYIRERGLLPQFRYLIGTPRATAADVGALERAGRRPRTRRRRPRGLHGTHRHQRPPARPLRLACEGTAGAARPAAVDALARLTREAPSLPRLAGGALPAPQLQCARHRGLSRPYSGPSHSP